MAFFVPGSLHLRISLDVSSVGDIYVSFFTVPDNDPRLNALLMQLAVTLSIELPWPQIYYTCE